ncbi:hypothetical protein GTY83_07075 [Streptomyces sp. SID4928]|uniref:hypothetical protein n=1 Tax=unclassified Streptomyces TaxID=2593676 RepID=UPI0001C1C9A0|nr:hypothetical protein [Streptomyces sp. ACT-1]EGE40796.1 hypothetical protein SACT1_1431 [Streptomyces sp. ACT-1]MYR48867.1 hypothetical protein [Streptomyces sp. SID4928]
MATRRQVDVLFDLSDYPKGSPALSVAAPAQEAPSGDVDRAKRRAVHTAASRIRRIAMSPREQREAGWSPEQIVDYRTSMADFRIALCLVQGNALDDIDPASGYSMSRASYDTTRHSWISIMKFHGFNPDYDQVPLDEAVAFWAERRPQFLVGDDWLAAGLAGHRAYWQALDHPCTCPTCDESDES